MYEPRLQAEALSEACGVPTLRLDHAARFGQPLPQLDNTRRTLNGIVLSRKAAQNL